MCNYLYKTKTDRRHNTEFCWMYIQNHRIICERTIFFLIRLKNVEDCTVYSIHTYYYYIIHSNRNLYSVESNHIVSFFFLFLLFFSLSLSFFLPISCSIVESPPKKKSKQQKLNIIRYKSNIQIQFRQQTIGQNKKKKRKPKIVALTVIPITHKITKNCVRFFSFINLFACVAGRVLVETQTFSTIRLGPLNWN